MADDNANLQPDPQETLDANGGTPDVTPSALVGGSSAPDVSSPTVMPSPQSPGSPDEQDMDTQTSGGQDGPSAGSGSMWTRILQGALTGLAGVPQHGRSSFANGAIGGANAAAAAQQQQVVNQQNAQKLQMAQAQQDDAHQEANARLATYHVQLLNAQREYGMAPMTFQDALDQEDEKMGAQLQAQGHQPVFTGSYDQARQAQADHMASNQNAPLSTVTHKNTDGTYSVYDVGDPTKTNAAPVSVITGYHPTQNSNGTLDWDKPVAETVTAPANSITVANQLAAPAGALTVYNQRRAAAQQKTADEQTPEYKAKVQLMQAQAEKASRDNSSDKQFQAGIGEINNASVKGKDSYANFAAENNTFKDTLTAATNGDEVASNFAKTMGIMSVNKIGDLSRISPQEYAALGPDLGSLARQGAAILSKTTSGTLPADTVKELSDLQQRVSDIKYSSYLSNMRLIAQNRGMDPSKIVVLNQDGKTNTSLDKAQTPVQQSAGHKVGDVIVQSGKTFKVTAVDKDGKVTGAQ